MRKRLCKRIVRERDRERKRNMRYGGRERNIGKKKGYKEM